MTGVIYIFFGVTVVWLAALSFFLFKTRSHYLKLTGSTDSHSLEGALDKLMHDLKSHEIAIGNIEKSVAALDKDTINYFQKVGFVRFSPFDRFGGDQSFVVALLNKEDTGIVLNFLYTREGVRIYAKPVNKGKGTEYELAKEEQEAVHDAK